MEDLTTLGFGKTWLEAMAVGLCVIGFDEGGLPDVARHEREALLAPTGHASAFQDLLQRAVADPALVRRIGRAARTRASKHTWERHAEATVDFVDQTRQSRHERRE